MLIVHANAMLMSWWCHHNQVNLYRLGQAIQRRRRVWCVSRIGKYGQSLLHYMLARTTMSQVIILNHYLLHAPLIVFNMMIYPKIKHHYKPCFDTNFLVNNDVHDHYPLGAKDVDIRFNVVQQIVHIHGTNPYYWR